MLFIKLKIQKYIFFFVFLNRDGFMDSCVMIKIVVTKLFKLFSFLHNYDKFMSEKLNIFYY